MKEITLLRNPVPVVDLFAGPGGLGEGFNASRDEHGDVCFKTVLSIEKDIHAHMTLELRAFFRAFDVNVPEDYYLYIKGEISREELFRRHEEEVKAVAKQAWLAELGSAEFPPEYVDRRIREALAGQDIWVLIGGPPCQAYSTVGRSRMRGADPAAYEADHRHFLYREFLRILAVHRPPVFVMENVKGLLSARVNGQSIFERIIEDLKNPMGHQGSYAPGKSINYENLHYNLFSVSKGQGNLLVPTEVSQFVVESEKHGVPQRRHRVIIIGIRDDLKIIPDKLPLCATMFSTQDAIGDLPRLRSCLSKEDDSITSWLNAVRSITECHWLNTPDFNHEVRNKIISTCESLTDSLTNGGRFVPYQVNPRILHDWYHDDRLQGVCNHTTKSHMREDLHRYMFAACFAQVHHRTPFLQDFPRELLPNHRNVSEALNTASGLFSDRFRVQLSDIPATTITSHLAKDGHYFIHPDPMQCRSLTVREAARLQTFPDNYFFEGSLVSQYRQVGNAVPPILAREIADTVYNVIVRSKEVVRV